MGAVAFSQEAHDKNDGPGKEAACELYIRHGWEFIPKKDPKDKCSIDLQFRKDGLNIWVEAAVQHSNGMFGNLHNYKPKCVSILERKFKYGKPAKSNGGGWYGPYAFIFECNDDLTYAFLIQACKLNMDYMVEEDRGRGMEQFIMQPKEDFTVLRLR